MKTILMLVTSILSFLCFFLPMKRDGFTWKEALVLALQVIIYAILYTSFTSFSMPVILISYLCSFLSFYLLLEVPIFTKLYLSVWVFLVQGFLISMGNSLGGLFGMRRSEDWQSYFPVVYLFLVLSFLAVLYLVFTKELFQREVKFTGPRQTALSILIFLFFTILIHGEGFFFQSEEVLLQGLGNGFEFPLGEGFGLQLESSETISDTGAMLLGEARAGGIRLLSELYLLTFLYVIYLLFQQSAVEQELITMELLMKQQKAQYELSRENIALINRKTHDLKHQVRALRHIHDEEERGRYLDEIDDGIRIYESIVETGSEVLDIILTEKSLLCKDKGIEIHCVADGKKLAFMDAVDLYSIFGNILDNAIEEVQGFGRAEERQIDLLIYEEKSFLIVNVTNPLQAELTFVDQLPRTTKVENGFHGYGLRSVRHTVQKYGGNVNISAEAGMFSLKILFPL